MIHMHTQTHTHTIWHLQACNLYALATLPDIVHQNQRGSTKPTATPRTCETSCHFSKRARNTWPALLVFSYIKNTRFWRWMWSCHDFLLYRIRLLQPGYRSDTCLPACCVLGCFLQSRSWNGGFIMYMQRTSNSTRWGFNLPSDQFYECFKWSRWIAPMMLFLQKCLSIWNPFGPHYSRFLDRHCCSTHQSSKEVCSSFFAHLWPNSQKA